MLAVSAQPFDSSDYFFEVKWDGVRALAAVERNHWRVWGREQANYEGRYPELAVLRRLPSGTMVDGELVAFQDQRPDLPALLRRHQLVQAARIRHASRVTPVCYVLFDLLYHQGRSLLQEMYSERRSVLQDLLSQIDVPELVFSAGLAEHGQRFFEKVVAQGHEGIMAKRLSGPYLPGRRSATWKKIKPTLQLPCVIIGYTPSREGIHSILVAAAHAGPLRYVAEVTCGFSRQQKTALARRLGQQRRRSRPVVACTKQAVWVDPELYCHIQFLQWTTHGRMRSASFRGLIEED
jgi:DNA ligase D-like protein (predicted ligase)